MAPQIRSSQISDGQILRSDLNVATPGSAVVRRILPGGGVVFASTGIDAGTGDVTISDPATRKPLSGSMLINVLTAGIPTTGAAIVANTLRAMPIRVLYPTSINGIFTDVSTANAGDFRLGLYISSDANNNYPGALITGTDTAPILATPLGLRGNNYGTPIALPAGTVWIVSNASVGTSARSMPSSSSELINCQKATNFSMANAFQIAAVYAALPSTFPAGATPFSVNPYPIMGASVV
jgi:hypothetical protein